MTFAQMKAAIQEAALKEKKMAMFHYLVLKNAKKLESVDPVKFCQSVGVPDSYKSEFSKMINLAKVIQENESGVVFIFE